MRERNSLGLAIPMRNAAPRPPSRVFGFRRPRSARGHRLAATKHGRDWLVDATALLNYLESRDARGRPPTRRAGRARIVRRTAYRAVAARSSRSQDAAGHKHCGQTPHSVGQRDRSARPSAPHDDECFGGARCTCCSGAFASRTKPRIPPRGSGRKLRPDRCGLEASILSRGDRLQILVEKRVDASPEVLERGAFQLMALARIAEERDVAAEPPQSAIHLEGAQ